MMKLSVNIIMLKNETKHDNNKQNRANLMYTGVPKQWVWPFGYLESCEKTKSDS